MDTHSVEDYPDFAMIEALPQPRKSILGHCHINRFYSEIAVNCRWSPYALSMALSDKPEPACEGCRLRRSGRKLTPLSQSGRVVLLEDVAAIEMTVQVEMIVD